MVVKRNFGGAPGTKNAAPRGEAFDWQDKKRQSFAEDGQADETGGSVFVGVLASTISKGGGIVRRTFLHGPERTSRAAKKPKKRGRNGRNTDALATVGERP